MKKCIYCGLENADNAVFCTTCHTQFVSTPAGSLPSLRNEHLISPEEWRFWNRMTFRQFAVVIVRLAALWCFFEGALEAAILVRYVMVIPFLMSSPGYPGYPYAMTELFVPVLRVGLCVVTGFILFSGGERILSWLVRGAVQRQPPEISLAATTSASRITPIIEK
jgi:hypothetical protein